MENGTQKFLAAEEAAEILVSTLQQLHTEATSYQTATKELEVVRQRLLSMIEIMQQTAVESHKAILILNEMGGPKIVEYLQKIEGKIDEDSESNTRQLLEFENKVSQEVESNTKQVKKLTGFVYFVLAGLGISVVLNIILLIVK